MTRPVESRPDRRQVVGPKRYSTGRAAKHALSDVEGVAK
jgi:hypothetical protein